MDNLELMMRKMEELFDVKLQSFKEIIENSVQHIDDKRQVEVADLHRRIDRAEEKLEKQKAQIEAANEKIAALTLAPAKAADQTKKEFFKTGKEMGIRAIWVGFFAFIGFLIYQYIVNGGGIKP